jgi:hypothetical protein
MVKVARWPSGENPQGRGRYGRKSSVDPHAVAAAFMPQTTTELRLFSKTGGKQRNPAARSPVAGR